MHVAVVARGNGLAEARVLAQTLERQQPGWALTVLLMPGLRPELHEGAEPFEVLVPGNLEFPLRGLLERAPAPALAGLLRPLLAAELFARGADRVLVLAPDAELYGPLDALEAALQSHSAVLVPRLDGRLPQDGKRPDGADLVDAGEIDDELVAIRGDEVGQAFVTWWRDRAFEAAEAAAKLESPADATRLAASPLSSAERVFEGLTRLGDPGYDVSHWNLHERPLAQGEDELTAAGRPVRLLRWAGFRPDRPWWLSEHGSRTLVLDDPVLSTLVRRRAEALRIAGWLRLDHLSVNPDDLPNGLVYDARLQRLRAEAEDAGERMGDVISPTGADAFAEWLTAPAPQGAAAGLNRYSYDVWKERADVRSAYPDLDGPDAEGFLGWLWVHGREELKLQTALLPSPPDWAAKPEHRVPSVLVAGYLRGTLGLGQAGRAYTAALQSAGVAVATRTLAVDPPSDGLERKAPPRPQERTFTDVALPVGEEPEVNFLCVNADQTPELVEALGEEMDGRYTIASWAWETDYIPERWDRAFGLVDELWVYSTYIADNLARASNVPIVVMPLPVEAPDPAGATVPFAVPDGFVFLFVFDFFSTLERKNPLGLVEAFKQAFAPGEGPTLLLKTINADYRVQERERLRYAIGDRPDIVMVDQSLEPNELAALFTRADCYVSLHRAEGFGLTLAESMALGKPVIATGFSANTDFMTPSNSYLVDWELTEVGPDAEHYPANAHWAEPSLEHAAALMREVFDDQDAARARGDRARRDVLASLNTKAIGERARARLLRVSALRAGRAQPDERWPHPDLPGRLGFDLSGGAAGGARGLVRRGVFRALKPYTTSERALDETLVESIRRLSLELDAERAAWARERRMSAQRDARLEELRVRLETADRHRRAPDQERMAQELAQLLTAARAIPFMAGDPFEYFAHPVAGRVFGFRAAAGEGVPDEEAYRAFEDIFRGSHERVRSLAEPYAELMAGHGPVLDVGCGRGELLEVLRDAGIEARGVDLDAGMAARAAERGLDVVVGDGVAYVEGLEPASVGAIVSMQVIEHLPREALLRLFAAAKRALRPGGLFVAETVNPHAGHALKTFWVDLTHQHPVFPEVTLALAADAGFAGAFVCHLAGGRDAERDRFSESSYAVVATA
ncbi:methyltransferase domain-containing protein [Solirubrobacter phytolaccae]|uniref:Methyltransferase domain-containing protein n=1 Tax=Solirubrobacter phytolaccae TaxID=1404360 RepID=A0A9X3NCP4_9ACTN|nr:methyltransferase domain-containing protein [Solirubrobacter phytolaccae]MDA0182392.1 methyltransferase domain-containing protein [Solirubrobacter phytolaccae]